MGNTVHTYFHPGPYPETDGPPTFDPMLGFPDGRKKRVMIATEEEMFAARVPKNRRDYCAHIYMEHVACLRDNFPFYLPCDKSLHKYEHCEYEDYVLRMKEYERERRLLVRQQKKQKALEAAA